MTLSAPTKKMKNKKNSEKFSLCILNTRSVRNKTDELNEYVVDNDVDLFIATESWIRNEDTVIINKLVPANFDSLFENRKHSKGGGIAYLFKKSVKVSRASTKNVFSTFEILQLNVLLGKNHVRIVSVYCPPSTSVVDFLTEFAELLSNLNTGPGHILILGDFNLHDKANDSNFKKFLLLLDAFSLKQDVDVPTHRHNHILDLVITREHNSIIQSCDVVDHQISDHYYIFCNLTFPKSEPIKRTISFRKTKNIPIDKFRCDINSTIATKADTTNKWMFITTFFPKYWKNMFH
ncbi:hypothetical protein SNE40_001663 [Patella caerulea]|uniref:Endonuclease/exonuclease/phosphatase domain-containing protein n=1 Tax=Patella caerulea TaxID=87958 RepID=A0AAN8Q3T0_PATCE